MNNNIVIRDLSTIKARNLMRGMISNSDPLHAMHMLAKIRDTCSDANFKTAIEVLRENAIFKKNPIGRDFNKEFPRLIGQKAISVFKPSDILRKFSKHSKKILRLIELCFKTLEAISKLDFAKAVSHCRQIIVEDGVSICLLRHLHYIKNHVSGQPLAKEIDELLSGIAVENVRYIYGAIRELSSGKTDYLNISDKVNKAEESVSVVIARTFIDHIPRTEEVFSSTLSSLYLVSLFDAFLYLSRIQDAKLPFVPPIDKNLLAGYDCLGRFSPSISQLYDTSDSVVGLDFFRETFLLIEIGEFFRFKTVHSSLFNTVEGKEDRRTPFERELLQEYFEEVHKIASIGNSCNSYTICIMRYRSDVACHFQNSSALIYLLEKMDGKIGSDELEFVKLMSRTRDIGLICPVQYIESIKTDAQCDELKIVVNSLSHIKQKSQLKEHELRSVLQNAALKKFNGQLTELLGYIYTISPAVAEHLIQATDETFLSKLFQIIKNPNAAIQERANILEWYGNRIGDVSFLERAKNLRIDVQINRERGTIDDSRIYVDPVKFTQWVNDQVLDKLAILLEGLPQPVEPVIKTLAWDKVKTGISAHEQIASLLVNCYEEFCSNKIYGIASFLGRRIRHGTLKGTGYADVANFVKDDRFDVLFSIKDFEESYHSWLKNYETTLDDLRDKYLHLHDKSKPDGLIFRDFRSHSKRVAASHLLHDILKSFSINKSCVELPYIILEYCWRIIEEDLSNIRKLVMEKKAQYGVFRGPPGPSMNYRQRELQELCQDLNSLTAEKFRTIALWFNKPSIASPSADVVLLFKAVVSEIKGQFPKYHPRVIVDEQGFMLNGGTYFAIYDALFILISNAAENGKNDGHLEMKIILDDITGRKRVSITLTSELRHGDCMSDVKKSISSALDGDCEDALIFEGRSGIKKLKKMEQAGYIESVNYNFNNNFIHASFSFRIDY